MTAASLVPFVRRQDGLNRIGLLVEGAHCGGCVARIERLLRADPVVRDARVNLSLKRLSLAWEGPAIDADRLASKLAGAGFDVAPYATEALVTEHEATGQELLRCLGVAGFAATNTMMLAIAVWSGQVHDMGPATQALLQWLTGIVGVLAVAYAGRPFFRSALGALRARRTNIDVPISLGLILTTAISVQEMLRGGPDVYFDSATALAFVLLLGRVLEHRLRGRAREALSRLLALQAGTATVLEADGTARILAVDAIQPGMRILVRPGERVPVDGVVQEGRSSLDAAIVTGESRPVAAAPGIEALAGSSNGSAALVLLVLRPAEASHLAEIARLVERAEARRTRHRQLADRVAAVWTPILHGLALLTLLLWWGVLEAGLATALVHAVAVLIIACPCAIGLAVPATQVAATGLLLRRGVLLRSGDALERLAEADRVVFDKTGTLTTGATMVAAAPGDPSLRRHAASLAAASAHPHARAIAALVPDALPARDAVEHPGEGVVARGARLGSRAFVGVPGEARGAEIWLRTADGALARFALMEALRPGAAECVAALRAAGMEPMILSGDAPAAVAATAAMLGISDAVGGLRPAEKLARLEAMRAAGQRVLMVGDGLNDAPSLAAAHVSASFTHGAGASQAAADLVLPGDSLAALPVARCVARRSMRIVRQNLVLAALYNAALVPLAVAGLVTPLIAALAMSASSLTVTLNALRAGRS